MRNKRVTPSKDPAAIALHRVMTARTDAQHDAAIAELETCSALTAQGVRAKLGRPSFCALCTTFAPIDLRAMAFIAVWVLGATPRTREPRSIHPRAPACLGKQGLRFGNGSGKPYASFHLQDNRGALRLRLRSA